MTKHLLFNLTPAQITCVASLAILTLLGALALAHTFRRWNALMRERAAIKRQLDAIRNGEGAPQVRWTITEYKRG